MVTAAVAAPKKGDDDKDEKKDDKKEDKKDDEKDAKKGKLYTDKYDKLDIKSVLKSDRLLTGYIKCMMEEGSCTPEGKEIRTNLPDALLNGCERCTKTQKDRITMVLDTVIEKRPKDFKRLQEKYDKDNVYINKYRQLATDNGIKLPE